jgi:hypothetical protein
MDLDRWTKNLVNRRFLSIGNGEKKPTGSNPTGRGVFDSVGRVSRFLM